MENKQKICSIDLFRYLCAVLVIAVHTNPGTDIHPELGYICTQIIPRIGVPFFFAAAGYFYLGKLEEKKGGFFRYTIRILLTYTIWSAFYNAIEYYKWGQDNIFKYKHVVVEQFWKTGSYYHFWFFPALIFAVIVSTVFFVLRCKKLLIPVSMVLYALGCIGCAYHQLGLQIPVLGDELYRSRDFELIRRVVLMGFPFFVSGYFVYKIKNWVSEKISDKKLTGIFLGTVVFWLAEIWLVRTTGWQANIVITFGLYPMLAAVMLLLLRNPMPEKRKYADAARVTANFMYYSHPIFMMAFAQIALKYFNVGIGATLLFFLTVMITTLFGVLIYKWNNRVINFIVK